MKIDATPRALPALSIRQPWAWAIVTVGKDIENRDWRSNFRGRFLIHASKGCTRDEYCDAREFMLRTITKEFRGKDIYLPGWKELQRGGIVGEAEIVDCVHDSDSPWFVGEWGLVIRNVKPLPFTPCKGALGFFCPQTDTQNE